MKFFKTNAIAVVLFLIIAGTATADVPGVMNFQGRLTDAGGTPVADGSYSVTFAIYDDSVGGSQVWTETQSVTTTDGLFSVLLGEASPLANIDFGGIARYLAIKVGADPEMAPRSRLASEPFAYRVATVDGAGGGTINSSVSITPTGSPSSQPNLHVSGTNGAIGDHAAIEANADSGSTAIAVEAVAGSFSSDNGDRIAVRGQALALGPGSKAYGVYAYAASTEGFAYALYAETEGDSMSAAGVFLGNRVLIFTNSSDLGYSNAIGSYYRDNAIVAWGNIAGDGTIESEFGVVSVSHTPGSGAYEITLDITTSGNDPNLLVMNATAEVDAIPTSAAAARLISVDQIAGSGNSFNVYITTGSFSAVDNEFTFIVTGR